MTACPDRYSTGRNLYSIPPGTGQDRIPIIDLRKKTSDRQKQKTVQNSSPAKFWCPAQVLKEIVMSLYHSPPFDIPIIALTTDTLGNFLGPAQHNSPCGTTRLHPQGKGGPAGTYCVGTDPKILPKLWVSVVGSPER